MKKYVLCCVVLCCVVIFTSCKGKNKSESGSESGNSALRTLGSPESSEKTNPETPDATVAANEPLFTLKVTAEFTMKADKLSADKNKITITLDNGTVQKTLELEVLTPDAMDRKIQNQLLSDLDSGKPFGQMEGDGGRRFICFCFL
ncbi:MAG: hypothetical protein LBD19_01465 [Endomicrobium sp.]|nr:hypothetical protein [Endomicrobium sp.]